MPKSTGDPVVNYVKEAVIFLNNYGLYWRSPSNLSQYPEEDQRVWLWNIDKVLSLRLVVNTAPKMPSAVRTFMEGGPRPPITG